MATDSVERTTELGQQIVKLKAAQTKAGQGSNQLVPQAAPGREVMEGDMQIEVLLAAPAPTMAQLFLDRLPSTTAHLLAVEQGLP